MTKNDDDDAVDATATSTEKNDEVGSSSSTNANDEVEEDDAVLRKRVATLARFLESPYYHRPRTRRRTTDLGDRGGGGQRRSTVTTTTTKNTTKKKTRSPETIGANVKDEPERNDDAGGDHAATTKVEDSASPSDDVVAKDGTVTVAKEGDTKDGDAFEDASKRIDDDVAERRGDDEDAPKTSSSKDDDEDADRDRRVETTTTTTTTTDVVVEPVRVRRLRAALRSIRRENRELEHRRRSTLVRQADLWDRYRDSLGAIAALTDLRDAPSEIVLPRDP